MSTQKNLRVLSQSPLSPDSAMSEAAVLRERSRRLSSAKLDLQTWLHEQLLARLDLGSIGPQDLVDARFHAYVASLLDELLDAVPERIPSDSSRGELRQDLLAEVFGLGPLDELLADESVSEILVLDPSTIYVERKGKLQLSPAGFGSERALRTAIERILMPLGRRIDEGQPLVDARLHDGSRVNAIIPPLSLRGPTLTIRKFARQPFSLEALARRGACCDRMLRFLALCIRSRRNLIVSGGTGSGKTTLLSALSQKIDRAERIITVEDAAELQLTQPHLVRLETRAKNTEGRGAFSIRDLVRNALRMRPDRIIVGECRGGEALDMLQAMNTGHDGSLTTLHASSPSEALQRLETLCLMADVALPLRAIRAQIASAVQVLVQVARFRDGTRRITAISEVVGLNDEGEFQVRPLFEFVRAAPPRQAPSGSATEVGGHFRRTGYVPSFLPMFYELGLLRPSEAF